MDCCFGAPKAAKKPFRAFFRPIEAEFAQIQRSRGETLKVRNDAGLQPECSWRNSAVDPFSYAGRATLLRPFFVIRCRALWAIGDILPLGLGPSCSVEIVLIAQW
jgi:hypothetical protein